MRRKEIVTRLALGAVLTSAAFSFSGCMQTVYGPPPDVPEEIDGPVETVYGPPPGDLEPVDPADDIDDPGEDPAYDPSLDEIEDVYGPPPDVIDEDAEMDIEPYEPEDEMIEGVYGPPPDVTLIPLVPQG